MCEYNTLLCSQYYVVPATGVVTRRSFRKPSEWEDARPISGPHTSTGARGDTIRMVVSSPGPQVLSSFIMPPAVTAAATKAGSPSGYRGPPSSSRSGHPAGRKLTTGFSERIPRNSVTSVGHLIV